MPIQADKPNQCSILVAQDNRSALPIERLQDIYGSTLVLASTPYETSIAIADTLFNLIIVDMDLNGFGLVALLKTTGCINYHTPIIALVDTDDDSSFRKNLITSGFDDYLPKPLTADTLDSTIKFWCNNDAWGTPLNPIRKLLSKCNNNYSLVLTLCQKLFEELPLQINQIEVALEKKQYDTAFEATHKLNGSAKICCLQDIEEPANALEQCLILKQALQADGHFFVLRQCVSDFLKHRQQILDYLKKAGKQ